MKTLKLALMITIFLFTISFAKNINFVLLLDRSGSMNKTDPKYLVIPTSAYITEQLYFSGDKDVKMSIITFSNEAQILGNISKNALNNDYCQWLDLLQLYFKSDYSAPCIQKDKTKVSEIVKQQLKADGYTELFPALNLAYSLVRNEKGKKYFILLTDGMPMPKVEGNNVILRKIVGENLFNKVLKKIRKQRKEFYELISLGDEDALALEKRYLEAIINFAEKNLKGKINLIPIVFQQTEERGKVFLKRLSKIVNGHEIIYQVNRNNLISTVAQIIPRTDKNLLIYKNDNFTASESINIPKISKKIRIFFFFKNNNNLSDVNAIIEKSGSRIEPLESRTFYDKENNLIFKSLIIDKTGNIKIALSEGTPNTSLFIDTVADLIPSLEVKPEKPVIGEDFKLKFYLKTQEDYKLPLRKVTFIISGKDSSNSRRVLVRDANIINNEAIAKLNLHQGGNYVVEVKATFGFSSGINNLKKTFSKTIFVSPKISLKNRVFFDYVDSKSFSKNENIISNLPELGLNNHVEDKSVGIKNTTNTDVKDLMLSVEEPSYTEECPESYSIYCYLSTYGESWLKVSPFKNIRVKRESIFPIVISADIPSKIIYEIPDGLYTGYINLIHKGELLDTLQVNIPINIPKIVFDPSDTGKKYVPWKDDFLKKTFHSKIYYPPPEGDENFFYKVTIPVWNSINKSENIFVDFADKSPYGIVIEKDKAKGLSQDIQFKIEQKDYILPRKETGDPVNIEIKYRLTTNKDLKDSYQKTFIITADNYRDSLATVVVDVDIIPAFILRTIYFLLFLFFSYIFFKNLYKFWVLYPLRKRTIGRLIFKLNPNTKIDNNRFRKRSIILNGVKPKEVLSFFFKEMYGQDTLIIKNNLDKSEEPYRLSDINPNSEGIFVNLGKYGNLTLDLIKENENTVRVDITKSPVSFRNFFILNSILLVILIFILYSIFNPYFPLQKIFHPIFY